MKVHSHAKPFTRVCLARDPSRPGVAAAKAGARRPGRLDDPTRRAHRAGVQRQVHDSRTATPPDGGGLAATQRHELLVHVTTRSNSQVVLPSGRSQTGKNVVDTQPRPSLYSLSTPAFVPRRPRGAGSCSGPQFLLLRNGASDPPLCAAWRFEFLPRPWRRHVSTIRCLGVSFFSPSITKRLGD